MMHAKSIVADGRFVSAGTVNFDNRSMSFNDETTLLAVDDDLGARMERLFESDLRYSTEITAGAACRARDQAEGARAVLVDDAADSLTTTPSTAPLESCRSSPTWYLDLCGHTGPSADMNVNILAPKSIPPRLPDCATSLRVDASSTLSSLPRCS